jgi:hypothetical protein
VKRPFGAVLGDRLFTATFEPRDFRLGPQLAALKANGAPFFTRADLDHAAVVSLDDAATSLRARCSGGPRPVATRRDSDGHLHAPALEDAGARAAVGSVRSSGRAEERSVVAAACRTVAERERVDTVP